jgi:hypothetical protein
MLAILACRPRLAMRCLRFLGSFSRARSVFVHLRRTVRTALRCIALFLSFVLPVPGADESVQSTLSARNL